MYQPGSASHLKTVCTESSTAELFVFSMVVWSVADGVSDNWGELTRVPLYLEWVG